MNKIECPKCEGKGTISDEISTTSFFIDDRVVKCPICLGIGKINPDDIGTKLALGVLDKLDSISLTLAELRYENERRKSKWWR